MGNEIKPSGKPRKRYTPEFKASAVRQYKEASSVAELAKSLGVTRFHLIRWAKAAEELGPDKAFRDIGRPPKTTDDLLKQREQRNEHLRNQLRAARRKLGEQT